MTNEVGSLLPYVGVGGGAVCCFALELLGGVALLGGLAATVGLSTGSLYLAVVGLSGVLAAGIAVGYRHLGGHDDG